VPVNIDRRRVLLLARPTEARELHDLFAADVLKTWEPLEADTVERARFMVQHNPFDVLIVDENLYQQAGPTGLAWLAQQHDAPTVFLTGQDPQIIVAAYELGVSLCLPRRLTLDHPAVLGAALRRTVSVTEMQRGQRRAKERLQECRRQVDRLVNLLWRTAPTSPPYQLFTQRHIFERLQEEVARSTRYGSVFSVALGEVLPSPLGEQSEQETPDWSAWITDMLAGTKRRCDVAGHYGLRGFMLLMVETPKPGGLAGCQRLIRSPENRRNRH
jgi:DNA-binding NarL/FixJ family response regulator